MEWSTSLLLLLLLLLPLAPRAHVHRRALTDTLLPIVDERSSKDELADTGPEIHKLAPWRG